MTSKHHKWQTRWLVDLAAAQATHDSGLVVEFKPAHGPPEVEFDGRPLNTDQVLPALMEKHGQHNVGPMLARLLREAGDIYSHTLRDDNNRRPR